LTILLERTHEGFLFFEGLEATVTHLGSGIDELEFDRFQSSSGSLVKEGFSEGDSSLFGSADTSLDHDEIVLDKTVMDETTNWVDRFVSDIDFGGTIVVDFFAVDGVESGSDTVDLLVDFGSVMVSLLTGSSDGESNSRWMPGSNTGDLSETFVGLSGKFLCVPSRSDTVVTSTLGDTDAINHFGFREDGVD